MTLDDVTCIRRTQATSARNVQERATAIKWNFIDYFYAHLSGFLILDASLVVWSFTTVLNMV